MKNSLRVEIPAFITIRTVMNTTTRMVYPFLPVFARGLGVDLWMMSLALTIRATAGVLGPFLASVADSRGRKAGMIFGVILSSIGVGLMVAWPSYPTFVLTLVLTIVGSLVFIPSMQAYLGDRVPYQQRGRVLAFSEFGWSFSFILGVPAVGFLIARLGWLAPFPVLAMLGLAALIGLAWLLPKDPEPKKERPTLWRNFHTVFSSKPAVAGLLMGLSLSAANELVNVVFGVWMEDSFGLKIAALGAASAIIGVAELGGESLVSTLADRMGKPRAVAAGLILNSLAALALPVLGGSLVGGLVGLFFFYITFEFTLVSSLPLMTEVLPAARATLMAAFLACTSLGRALGAILAPPLYAWAFLAIAIAAVGFNLLAVLYLAYLRRHAGQEV